MQDDRLAGSARLGYLPENGPLYPDMTPFSLLEFFAEARGMTRAQKQERIDAVIDLCALGNVIHKPISKLSKGYRQRVGMAQALLHEPDVLILDEPTVGLDPNQIREVRRTMERLRDMQKTVLLSTHILQEVEAMASRVILIDEGRVKYDGAVADLDPDKRGPGCGLRAIDRTGDRRGKLDRIELSRVSENRSGRESSSHPTDVQRVGEHERARSLDRRWPRDQVPSGLELTTRPTGRKQYDQVAAMTILFRELLYLLLIDLVFVGVLLLALIPLFSIQAGGVCRAEAELRRVLQQPDRLRVPLLVRAALVVCRLLAARVLHGQPGQSGPAEPVSAGNHAGLHSGHYDEHLVGGTPAGDRRIAADVAGRRL